MSDKIKRCEVCGWPLVERRDEGCVEGDCSYRPEHGSDEWLRIHARRRELARAPSPDLDRLRGENERLREALRTVDARLDNLGLEEDTSARRTIAAALEPQ